VKAKLQEGFAADKAALIWNTSGNSREGTLL
jgi:hypothetical protein